MAFRLALAWQVPDPDWIEEQLPASLLDKWQAFYMAWDEGWRFQGEDETHASETMRDPNEIWKFFRDQVPGKLEKIT